MPTAGSSIVIEDQIIRFVQIPESGSSAVIEGVSGDATRRIEFTTE